MRKLDSVLCIVVMISASLLVFGGSAGASAAPRANETCNVPTWNPGDTWNMSINYNPNTQTVSSGITITITNYQETTSHVMRGTRLYGGHNSYILSVYSNYSSAGTWDAGGGLSGSISDTGHTVGEQYQRVSDLAYVGSDLNMSGSQDIGLGPTAYNVRALSTSDTPTTYFKFPLICSSPNQTWHTASAQTTQITGTASETQINTYIFDSYVEGYESTFVQAGTFDTFRIRNAGTQDRVIGGQPQAQVPYNGNIYYAPEVKHEVKDTNIGMTVTSYYLESPKPDLSIGQANITLNATATVGKALKVNGNVTNKIKSGAWMGNATDVVVRFFDGSNQIDTDQTYIGNMTPGMTRNFNVTWTPDAAGTHTIKVTVDPDGLINELDRTNN